MRRLRLSPAPPGQSHARDRVKAAASSAATAVELVAAKARRRG
jgi:hypothetical protein